MLTVPCLAILAPADDAERSCDDLRTPASAGETARRLHGLTDQQEPHLACWGNPSVVENLTVHVSTERLGDTQRALEAALAPLVGPVCGLPWRCDVGSLLRRDTPGVGFVLQRRLPLGG